jgi:hypothetical protein
VCLSHGDCLSHSDKRSSIGSTAWFPHRPMDAAAVERRLVKAGFSAMPASSRSIAASAALAGCAYLGDVLCPRDWSSASTFFRFHHAL